MTTAFILNSIGQRGVGIRVEFHRVGDRFSHTISIVNGDEQWRLATSIEGNDNAPWPASPPVQEVHQQGDLLFLTGMAGDSYWSTSVSPVEQGGLLFDVACRAKSSPQHLSIGYELSPEIECEFDADGAQLNIAGKRIGVALPSQNIELQGTKIISRWTESITPPATVQWKTTWQLPG